MTRTGERVASCRKHSELTYSYLPVRIADLTLSKGLLPSESDGSELAAAGSGSGLLSVNRLRSIAGFSSVSKKRDAEYTYSDGSCATHSLVDRNGLCVTDGRDGVSSG